MHKLARLALLAVLGLLVLNALAYGCWFIASPHEGFGEFGQSPEPAGKAALYLVGLVGVVMLGAAAFALLAMYLLIRGRAGGLPVAVVLGICYLGVGLYALLNEMPVDALIYGGFGVLVTGLVAVLGLLESKA